MRPVEMVKERFSQLVATMSPRDRWLFMGLVLTVYAAILGGLWYFGHGFLADVRSRIDSEQQTLASLSGMASDQAEAATEVAHIEAELKKNAGTDLSTFVEKAAQKIGISTSLQVRERETSADGNLESKTFSVEVQKISLQQVKDFLYELESTGYPLKVTGARFKTTTLAGVKVLNVSLDVTAFRLIEIATETP
jgi:type II secretory pathway component PulM